MYILSIIHAHVGIYGFIVTKKQINIVIIDVYHPPLPGDVFQCILLYDVVCNIK